MTLIEILVLLIPGALGAFTGARVVAWMGGADASPALQGLGALIGAPLGPAALHVMYYFSQWWRPHRPRCARDTCDDSDYTLIRYEPNPSEGEQRLLTRVEREKLGLLLRCQCGDLYIHSYSRRQLSRAELDGTTRPSKHCRLFGRWRPDTRPRSAPPRP